MKTLLYTTRLSSIFKLFSMLIKKKVALYVENLSLFYAK